VEVGAESISPWLDRHPTAPLSDGRPARALPLPGRDPEPSRAGGKARTISRRRRLTRPGERHASRELRCLLLAWIACAVRSAWLNRMAPNEESSPLPEAPALLPDEAVVVRGGLSSPMTLAKNALGHHDDPANVRGDFAISACSLPNMSAEDLARIGQVPHPRIRETTVGRLRAAGYDVIRDEPPQGHALIMLPRLPTDRDYVTISALFDPPRLNPLSDD
jgi:hypothetical protein